MRPLTTSTSKQRLKQFVGISGANSGARGLSMNRVVIPPSGQAAAHRHVGSESAIFLLAGRVKTFYGPCLEKSVINQTGDFLFIPAGITHMPVNLSASEAAIAIVARNDANEQEHVELHAPPGKAESAPGTPGLPKSLIKGPLPPSSPLPGPASLGCRRPVHETLRGLSGTHRA